MTQTMQLNRKTKLIGRWMKTFETGDTGATTIAFTNMTAFKFPDSDNIYLTCNIEVFNPCISFP